MRIFILIGLALMVMLLLASCGGGSSRHTVTTDEDGSMLGLLINPEPQSLGIDRNDDLFLDWPAGYTPPAQFTVSLRQVADDASTTAIFTNLETESTGHYILKPTSTLPEGAFLLLRIDSDREHVRAMYLTDKSAFGMTRAAKPGEEGQAEHTVRTR